MERIDTYFKALSEESRLRILKLLEEKELCVCDLTAALEMTQPTISFHLGILREAGLIKERKEGRWSYYDLNLSNIINRIIIPIALEKTDGIRISEDKLRLEQFAATKVNGNGCAKKACATK